MNILTTYRSTYDAIQNLLRHECVPLILLKHAQLMVVAGFSNIRSPFMLRVDQLALRLQQNLDLMLVC